MSIDLANRLKHSSGSAENDQRLYVSVFCEQCCEDVGMDEDGLLTCGHQATVEMLAVMPDDAVPDHDETEEYPALSFCVPCGCEVPQGADGLVCGHA